MISSSTSWTSCTTSCTTTATTAMKRSSTPRRVTSLDPYSRRWRMRQRGAASGGLDDFPAFPIGPILEAFGGLPVVEGLGWKPYRCPFHDDTDASASVNTQRQVFNCHAADCPKGSATQVLMKHEGITYVEAVKRAEEIAGGDHASVRGSRGRGGGV